MQRVRAEGFEVLSKGDKGPVTRADHEADALLREALPAILPAAWLSEETVDDPVRLGQRRLWVVDPLDGTKEFVEGVPHYAVSAGLVEDGVALLGVVHNPSDGTTVWAVRGGGCFRDGKPVRVAEGRRLGASRSEIKRGEFEPFAADWTVEPLGSIAWKLALVAAGEIAATVSRGPKHEWDVCGGAMLVEEAGGQVADCFGGALRFNQSFPKTKGVLAGAPEAYGRVAAKLAEVGVSDRMDEMKGR
ncbi:MAG: 3'(2'),5'-bisphosphate nucleotidase CysQ [Planctomycetes bacterium]|nr:3'(2'),5'-bisphosphate nucleotidase CysQ [Planctomycetota bacterium]